jgi:hypothetical protein
MSITNYRASEPLYIIIIREKNAEQALKVWAKTANVQVQIDTNRMKLFDQRTLNLFQLNWSGAWDNVTIWDCWNKRHINSD